jgi:hypothetical protein
MTPLPPEDTAAMSPHRKLFTSLCLASTLAWASAPALAEDDQDRTDEEDPMELAEEGVQKLIFALELMLQAIPQYAMPEILENGDIIIRRVDPEEGDDAPNGTKNGETGDETDI